MEKLVGKTLMVALLSLAIASTAQEPARALDGYWLVYFGDNRINDRIGLHTEYQARNLMLEDMVHTHLLRLGINFYTSRTTILTAGYGYFSNELVSPHEATRFDTEHRAWQQLITRSKTNRFFVEHRYRLEQRFVTPHGADQPVISHRGRYRLQTIFPLYTLSPRLRHYFMSANNEIMLNFVNEHAGVFDRNRLYLAVGYQVSPKLNFQIGYLNQVARQKPSAQLERLNHLQFTVAYNMDDLMAGFFRRPAEPNLSTP